MHAVSDELTNHSLPLGRAGGSSSASSPHEPIYVDPNQSWELTWPIWHMLPRSERKNIARQYGYSTIGDFEEFMSLSRALRSDSNIDMNNTTMHTRDTITSSSDSHGGGGGSSHTISSAHMLPHKQYHPSYNMESTNEEDGYYNHVDDFQSSDCGDINLFIPPNTEQQNLRNGGKILILPDDILIYRVLAFLDVEYFALCALVSPHWKTFTRTEAVYREICHRCYLQQSKRKELHVSRFGNSYRNMLYMRPRVKTGGGLYVLKFSQIKKIQRDMWTEVSPNLSFFVLCPTYMYMYKQFV